MIKAYLNLTGDDEDKYVYEIEGSGNMNDMIAEIELLIGSMFTTIREKKYGSGRFIPRSAGGRAACSGLSGLGDPRRPV